MGSGNKLTSWGYFINRLEKLWTMIRKPSTIPKRIWNKFVHRIMNKMFWK